MGLDLVERYRPTTPRTGPEWQETTFIVRLCLKYGRTGTEDVAFPLLDLVAVKANGVILLDDRALHE